MNLRSEPKHPPCLKHELGRLYKQTHHSFFHQYVLHQAHTASTRTLRRSLEQFTPKCGRCGGLKIPKRMDDSSTSDMGIYETLSHHT